MASLARPLACDTAVSPPAIWEAIRNGDCPIVIEPRALAGLAALADGLASAAPFEVRGEGTVSEAVVSLGNLPLPLRHDILRLATRFAALMAVSTVRIRLEGIVTNACRKIHSDNADVRLITTYCGPGTDYIPRDMAPADGNLQRIPTGWVALFKGRAFDPVHAFCLHRSPPAGDMDVARLVLVIDTPLRPELAKLLSAQTQVELSAP